LMWRPGELSRLYFANRRASHIPPFRLYLIVSVVYFALLGLGGSTDGAVQVRAESQDTNLGCNGVHISMPKIEARAREICRKVAFDGGAELGRMFIAALPRAMFLFLPLIAAAMMLFYWRPRRFYVEHLVFYLHNHAAVFVASSTVMLLQLVARVLPLLDPVTKVLKFALFFWVFVYLFLAMRRFYRQRKLLTGTKLVLVAIVYGVVLGLMMSLTLLYTAIRVA
jgi:Protein of unknown function (DUF3667)